MFLHYLKNCPQFYFLKYLELLELFSQISCSWFFQSLYEQPNFQQVHIQVLFQTVIDELGSVYEQLFTSSLKECLNLFHEKIFKIFMKFFFSELVFKVFQVPQWTLGFLLGSCLSSFPDSDSRTLLLRSSLISAEPEVYHQTVQRMEHSWREREKRKKNENFINIWLFIQNFLLKAASVKISTLLMPCRYVNILNNWLNSEILCFEYCFHLQEGFKIA